MAKKEMTKAELIKAIKEKGKRASPQVKRIAFRGLEYKTKAELRRQLRKMHVTREGDISYI